MIFNIAHFFSSSTSLTLVKRRTLQLRLGEDGCALNLDVSVEGQRLDGDAATEGQLSFC